MRLRKTLAGILGAVVMLLGVGTFEHVNKETGVHAAEEVASIDFSAQGYTNQTEISLVEIDSNVSVTFNKGTNNTTPKYYTTGTAVRIYGGGYFVVDAGTYSISEIVLTYGSGDGSNAITTDDDSFSDGTWTGNATSVTFSIGGTSGHRRIKKIEVTYDAGSDPIKIAKPNVTIDAYSGLATWGENANAIEYEYVILENDIEVKTETIETTSVQLLNGQSIKVKVIGDGTNYADSDYSDSVTYNEIPVSSTVQGWINAYSEDGAYTKKSQIYLNYTAVDEIIEYFHQDDDLVHQNRTTYYKNDSLFMCNIDGTIGGENGINSGYRTNGTNLEHFVLNSNNEAIKDWEVKNTTLKEFFVTLDTFESNGYFDSWTLISDSEAVFIPEGGNLILDNSSDSVKDFLAFAAPCLEETILTSDYIKLAKLSISKQKNTVYGEYLSFKIYVSSGDKTKVMDSSKCILSEARVYNRQDIFDEEAKYTLNIKMNSNNGTYTQSLDKEYYKKGDTVVITVNPNENYEVSSFTVNKTETELLNNQYTWVASTNTEIVISFKSTIVEENKYIYDFTSTSITQSELNTSTLLAAFNNSTSGEKIVNAVTATSKMYGANTTQGPKVSGLKSGGSSATGSFTITTTKDVTKVTVVCYAWSSTSNDTVSVNGSATQKAGATSAATLVFEITSTRTISFNFNKRVVIQQIIFE